jgi:hypothetical protein
MEQKREAARRQAVRHENENDAKIVQSMDGAQKQLMRRRALSRDELDLQLAAVQAANNKLVEEIQVKAAALEEAMAYAAEMESIVKSTLNRNSVMDDMWHAQHPKFAPYMLGLPTWAIFKEVHSCLWPEISISMNRSCKSNATSFEKSLLTRIHFRKGFEIETLALMFGRDRTTLSKYVAKWAPRWGVAGEDLSILDLTEDILARLLPLDFKRWKHMKDIGALVDGKDFLSWTLRKHSGLSRAMYSDKSHHSALRVLSWILPCGLNFEHTWLFLGRATEPALVSLWGSLVSKTPLEVVPKHTCEACLAGEIPDSLYALKPSSANNAIAHLCTKRTEEERVADDLEELEALTADASAAPTATGDTAAGAPSTALLAAGDVQLAAAAAPPAAMPMIPPAALPATSSAAAPAVGVPTTARQNVMAFMERNMARDEKNGKQTLYNTESVVELNQDILKSGPDQSAARKLQQLSRHKRLYASFEAGILHSCMLTDYLAAAKNIRQQQLRVLQGTNRSSDVAENLKLPLRLAKIPPGYRILADRGFVNDAGRYPNANAQMTPHFLSGRAQFPGEERSSDMVTCMLRYGSETNFARVTSENILRDTIPSSHFQVLDHANHWAHASANFCQHFKQPDTTDDA